MELSLKKIIYCSLTCSSFLLVRSVFAGQYAQDLQEIYELSQNNASYCEQSHGVYSGDQFDDTILAKCEQLKTKWDMINNLQNHTHDSFERLNLISIHQETTPELRAEANRIFDLLYEGALSVSMLLHFYENLILMLANCRGYEDETPESSFDGLIACFIHNHREKQELMVAADALYEKWQSVDVKADVDEGKLYKDLSRYGQLRESFKKLLVTKYSSLNKKTYSGVTKNLWKSGMRKTTRWFNTGVITNEADNFDILSKRLELEAAPFLNLGNWTCMIKYLIDEKLWRQEMYQACVQQCIKSLLKPHQEKSEQTIKHRPRTRSMNRY